MKMNPLVRMKAISGINILSFFSRHLIAPTPQNDGQLQKVPLFSILVRRFPDSGEAIPSPFTLLVTSRSCRLSPSMAAASNKHSTGFSAVREKSEPRM